MKTFVPYEKLSKREQRKSDRMKRGSWGSICPVTRKPISSRAYNRAAWKRLNQER